MKPCNYKMSYRSLIARTFAFITQYILKAILKLTAIAILSMGMLFQVSAFAADVSEIRVWQSPDKARLVFDVSQAIDYSVFTLENPDRVVIDLKSTIIKAPIPSFENTIIKGLRSGAFDENTLRVVLDLNQPVRPKAFKLPKTREFDQRLVVDLFQVNAPLVVTPGQSNNQAPQSVSSATTSTKVTTKTQTAVKNPPVITSAPSKRKFVVAVDAGHGGEDPGAIGKHKTKEKNVVLPIAKKLVDRINKHPNMRAVLTRTGDYYVGLGKRTALARKEGADLFVSIHADAVERRSAKGSSVYVLSNGRASSEQAKALADKENKADLFGGVIDGREPQLQKVLVDMARGNTLHESILLAKDVISQLKSVGNVHSATVGRASFAVLKSLDIPSILVETAFISNPSEEKKLLSAAYQNKLADAVYSGLLSYAERSGFAQIAQTQP